MDIKEIVRLLEQKIPTKNIKIHEPMKAHTTFKIGGEADVFISPHNEQELIESIKICRAHKLPFYIIGNGSNLLVSDKGIRGVVIEIHKNLSDIQIEGKEVTAYAGTLLSSIGAAALAHTLTGFEFAHGIPGTLGGAVTMNAGAYGSEIKDVLVEATVIDEEGKLKVLTKEQLELGYRNSRIQKQHYIVVKAKLKLEQGQEKTILDTMKELTNKRKEKQPLEFPSAGSTFKRPEGYFAGKLIMDSGLRGYQIGGAKVADKHCGFVINEKDATFGDVINLIEYVQQVVKEKFDVILEPEVRIVGER